MRARARAGGGFTLVELLVAMAVFAVIASAVYWVFFVSYRAVKYTEESLLRLHEMRRAIGIIRRELEGALPVEEGLRLMDRDLYGRAASGLEFTTVAGVMEGASRVSYRVEQPEPDNPPVLVKGVRRAWDPEDRALEAEFVEDVMEFSVEVSTGAGGQWNEWDGTFSQDGLPRMMRITITAMAGEREVTLSETAIPMVGRGF